jgi:hypothetical protein
MKDLETALSLLQNSGIRPDKEMYRDLEKEEFVAIRVYWSPISRQPGHSRIKSIIGEGYNIQWQGNSCEFRITVKT